MSEKAIPDGIPCPRCRGTNWSVYSTRHETGRMVRVRTCAGCRLRVRTGERIEAVLGDSPGRDESETQAL